MTWKELDRKEKSNVWIKITFLLATIAMWFIIPLIAFVMSVFVALDLRNLINDYREEKRKEKVL